MARILDSLPTVYSHFLPDLFSAEQVNETVATCDDCAMCESPTHGEQEVRRYSNFPNLFQQTGKCCTYFPVVPNYLVGGVFSDASPEMAEGQRRMRERILGRRGATPLVVSGSPSQRLLYMKRDWLVYGDPDAVICPYYARDTGMCTIWRYREATCSTYYCKHDEGIDGQKYWKALQEFLDMIEVELAAYALWKVSPALYRAQPPRRSVDNVPISATEISGRPMGDDEYGALWGEWVGREAELYRACYEAVRALTPEAFQGVIGSAGQVYTQMISDAYQKVVKPLQLPEVLTFNPGVVAQFRNGEVVLSGYNLSTAVPMPTKAFWVLRAELNGLKPLEAVRSRLNEANITDEMLRTLVRLDVLRPA